MRFDNFFFLFCFHKEEFSAILQFDGFFFVPLQISEVQFVG